VTRSARLGGVERGAVDPNVLRSTEGYLVADARGRLLGRVERTAEGGSAGGLRLWVRGRLPLRKRRVVPASAVDEVDETAKVVVLSVERGAL
jgi:hypothetical protein